MFLGLLLLFLFKILMLAEDTLGVIDRDLETYSLVVTGCHLVHQVFIRAEVILRCTT
jgi:hypothetical protein